MNCYISRIGGKGNQGFTLIELMIVVAIVALLAAVGYPSYTAYVTKSHRQAGKNFLYSVADRQEQFFQDNKRYAANMIELGYGPGFIVLDDNGQFTDALDKDGKYVIDMINITATTYTVRATPAFMQLQRDTECMALTLTHRGEQDVTGDGDNCW
jgi:type IV pilus assembly protein PilE